MMRPIFVVGCPRSGTTLLYSMIVAAGGFAFYRKETHFYDVARRYPMLRSARARRRFLDQFLAGYLGNVPGLDVEPMARDALAGCRRTSEFLPRLMTTIAAAQAVERWIEGTPAHVLYMDEIARSVPDALFLHVVRDGRDCAASIERQGYISMLPWDRRHQLGVAALFWEWMVRAGRDYAGAHPATCLEVRYEALTTDPRRALRGIGEFIQHDLDYDRIAANPVHALKQPNTSFRDERRRGDFDRVERWRARSAEDVRMCESLVGPLLDELGYPCAFRRQRRSIRALQMRALYLGLFALKHFLKAHTPLGPLVTSTRVWNEQPRAGEDRVRPIPAVPALSGDPQR